MAWRHRLDYFLKQLNRERAKRELEREIQSHLEMETEENLERGLSPDAARLEARRAFGSTSLAAENSYDASGFGALDRLLQDVKNAIRVLKRSRGFAATALVSLALGIGANTAVFSLMEVVTLRRLPVGAPEELVIIGDPAALGRRWQGDWGGEIHSYPVYESLRASTGDLFVGLLAAGSPGRLDIEMNGTDLRSRFGTIRTRVVTGNYFDVLQVRPALGRLLSTEDDRSPRAHPVAVISYGLWQRLGADRSLLGKTLHLNGAPFEIVGVASRGFSGEAIGFPVDLWIPMMMQAEVMTGRDWLNARNHSWLQIMGRRHPSVSLATARAKIATLFAPLLREQTELSADDLEDVESHGLEVSSGAGGLTLLRSRLHDQLVLLMAVVGLVLLIACANLASMLLARAPARYGEISLRMALGASRPRLVRQLLIETLLLSGASGAVALLLTYWGMELLSRQMSSSPTPVDLTPSFGALIFAGALSLATGIAFGLVPAFRATKAVSSSALKSRTSLGGNREWWGTASASFSWGNAMVVAQVALSLLLVIGAGLFLRSLQNLRGRELGYDPKELFLVQLDPVGAGYRSREITELCRRLMERIGSIPGVVSVTFSENGLFSGTESAYDVLAEGFEPKDPEDRAARFDQIGPHYFERVGIPLLRGRDFTNEDDAGSPPVVILNETMARFYFGDENPIGRRISADPGEGRPWSAEIVGVAADARDHDLREATPRRFYVPYYQHVFDVVIANFEIRAPVRLTGIGDQIRTAIQEVDPDLPIRNLATLGRLIDSSLRNERQIAFLSTLFGLLALALASIGVYGVMSYAVARRTNEIGIRMALGARRRGILTMVLGETLSLVAIGSAIGIPVAIAASRLVASQLFGIAPTDPGNIALATGILFGIAALAGFLPARRAAQVDPLVALRYE